MHKKILFLYVLTLFACDQRTTDEVTSLSTVVSTSSINNRWYTQADLESGAKTYQKYCLQCHNKNATGTQDWKTTLGDGNYPPPPINGTAHAWHHDIGTLTRTIKNGGIPLGGVMPGFANKLSDAEVRSVIAYFQNFWNDDIYNSWLEIGGLD